MKETETSSFISSLLETLWLYLQIIILNVSFLLFYISFNKTILESYCGSRFLPKIVKQ